VRHLLLIFLFCFGCGWPAYSLQAENCQPISVENPGDSAIQMGTLTIDHVINASVGELDLSNETPFVILVELLGAGRQHILTVAFYNRGTVGHPLSFKYAKWLLSNAGNEVHLINSRETVKVMFESPLIVPEHCPTVAHLTYADLEFENKSHFRYREGLTLDPVLADVDALPKGRFGKGPGSLSGVVHLSENGLPLSDAGESPGNQELWATLLQACNFTPKIVAGQKSAGSLRLVFYWGSEPNSRFSSTDELTQVAVAARQGGTRNGPPDEVSFTLSTGGVLSKPRLRTNERIVQPSKKELQ